MSESEPESRSDGQQRQTVVMRSPETDPTAAPQTVNNGRTAGTI